MEVEIDNSNRGFGMSGGIEGLHWDEDDLTSEDLRNAALDWGTIGRGTAFQKPEDYKCATNPGQLLQKLNKMYPLGVRPTRQKDYWRRMGEIATYHLIIATNDLRRLNQKLSK